MYWTIATRLLPHGARLFIRRGREVISDDFRPDLYLYIYYRRAHAREFLFFHCRVSRFIKFEKCKVAVGRCARTYEGFVLLCLRAC